MKASSFMRKMALATSMVWVLLLAQPCLAQEQNDSQGGQLSGETIQPVKVMVVEEENPDFHHRVSFGPLGMLFGAGNFTWEYELAPSVGLEIAPWGIYFGLGDDSLYGAGLGLGAAFYVSGNAPEGLRFSVSVAPGFINASDSGSNGAFLFGAKALFGYTWIWRNGFSIGLSGGVQYMHFSIDGVDSALNGILPAMDFNLGFAF